MTLFDFVKPNVAKMEAKKDVKGLIKAVAYKKSEWIRRDAKQALEKIADSQAVEPLIGALQNNMSNVRSTAAHTLGIIGDSRAMEPLVTSLNDSDRYVRGAAAEALGKIGHSLAVKPLVTSLNDSNGDVRRAAAEALGKIGHSLAMEPLVAALNDSDFLMRKIAAKALSKISDPRVVKPLINALNHHCGYVRAAAATGLGQLKHHWAIEPLIACLKDPEFSVRTAADAALKAIGPPSDPSAQATYWISIKEWDKIVPLGTAAVDQLIHTFMEGEDNVCASVASVLGKIGDTRAVPSFIAVINEWYSNAPKTLAYENVREAVIVALGDLGDLQAIEPLKLVLRYEWEERRVGENTRHFTSMSVREMAVRTLEKLHWQPDCSEAGAAFWGIKGEWDRCVEIGPPAVELLLRAFWGDRENVVGALLRIGDARAVEPIMSVLNEEYNSSSGIRHEDGRVELIPQMRGLGKRIAIEVLAKESVRSMFATCGWMVKRETKTARCTRCLGSKTFLDLDKDVLIRCEWCEGTGMVRQEHALFKQGGQIITVVLKEKA